MIGDIYVRVYNEQPTFVLEVTVLSINLCNVLLCNICVFILLCNMCL